MLDVTTTAAEMIGYFRDATEPEYRHCAHVFPESTAVKRGAAGKWCQNSPAPGEEFCHWHGGEPRPVSAGEKSRRTRRARRDAQMRRRRGVLPVPSFTFKEAAVLVAWFELFPGVLR